MVTIRSPLSISCDRALSSVVLPEPVPPEIRMLRRERAPTFRTVAMASDMFAWDAMISSVMPFLANLRIEIDGPSIASGGMMMLTRLPSSSRASTSGEDSSTRRPTPFTMRAAMFSTCELSRNCMLVSSSLPLRSTYTCFGSLTMMSVMLSSISNGSNGPSPNMSLMSVVTRSRAAPRD